MPAGAVRSPFVVFGRFCADNLRGHSINDNRKHELTSPWIIFVAYWAIGALRTRRTVSHESSASRTGILDRHVVPQTYALAATGVAFTWIGIAIALWARYPTRISVILFIPDSTWQRSAEPWPSTNGAACWESS